MGKPYIPVPPVEAHGLPLLSVELLLLEAWLEVEIARAKPKKWARMIADLYTKAAELEAMGKVSRIRSLNRPAENGLSEMRRQAAATLRAFGDLFSRHFIDDRGR